MDSLCHFIMEVTALQAWQDKDKMGMSKRDVQSAMTPITLSLNAVVEAMFWTPTETRAAGGDELRGK